MKFNLLGLIMLFSGLIITAESSAKTIKIDGEFSTLRDYRYEVEYLPCGEDDLYTRRVPVRDYSEPSAPIIDYNIVKTPSLNKKNPKKSADFKIMRGDNGGYILRLQSFNLSTLKDTYYKYNAGIACFEYPVDMNEVQTISNYSGNVRLDESVLNELGLSMNQLYDVGHIKTQKGGKRGLIYKGDMSRFSFDYEDKVESDRFNLLGHTILIDYKEVEPDIAP